MKSSVWASSLGGDASQLAQRLWAPAQVAGMYAEVYGSLIEQRRRY